MRTRTVGWQPTSLAGILAPSSFLSLAAFLLARLEGLETCVFTFFAAELSDGREDDVPAS
jgi:hypothetical protein